jgi:hypothetical protein
MKPKGKGRLFAALSVTLLLFLALTAGKSYAWFQKDISAEVKVSSGVYGVSGSVTCGGETDEFSNVTQWQKTYTADKSGNLELTVSLGYTKESTIDCQYALYFVLDNSYKKVYEGGVLSHTDGSAVKIQESFSNCQTVTVYLFTAYVNGTIENETLDTLPDVEELPDDGESDEWDEEPTEGQAGYVADNGDIWDIPFDADTPEEDSPTPEESSDPDPDPEEEPDQTEGDAEGSESSESSEETEPDQGEEPDPVMETTDDEDAE